MHLQPRIKILVTGATGNVGFAVIRSLNMQRHDVEIVAAVRNIEEDSKALAAFKTGFIPFDFTDIATYGPALKNCTVLFLLRPPQISQVDAWFRPLIEVAKQSGVSQIVFLSVQGVEKSSFIPHHKIETLIRKSNIHYTFLRPAYFMQNFTTTLRQDLVVKRKIFLPSGRAIFTLIDVEDIGNVAANILIDPEAHADKSYDLTCNEKLSFSEMAKQLTAGLGVKIEYQSPGLLHFFLAKRKEKLPVMLIFVMIALHYLPRFQTEPAVTDWVRKITGREPRSFRQFIADNKAMMVDPGSG